MKESPLSPLINTAKGYLQQARESLDADRRPDLAIAYGLDLLGRVLSEAQKELAEGDMAEVAVVYDALAGQVAEVFGMSVPEAFRALAELCDDSSARLLVAGQPAPDAAQLALLRSGLVWITVTYQVPRGRRCRRSAEIVYRARDGAPVSRKVTQEFGWEDLPDRSRERILTGDARTVRYQLYPAKPRT
ncbi:hypothetical protein ACFOY4_35795 [Actinomadura syzygii]|uniref:Uncharacterized protein n=1 Tax=Actinomadura syzygii TaxID=1427538 RepID=A0A5D0TVJ4_9ACTN|nr:hypothetical protein [Actinomadura syzygii]TYC08889.1 hypothetical protein FXF65_35745 [Actinomadura syzygii]